jgi:hypothetical protein|tara:strand:+ start:1066 stop:1200 length:135 start_codon:yes stop_codon:yes gene_type:complete
MLEIHDLSIVPVQSPNKKREEKEEKEEKMLQIKSFLQNIHQSRG